MENCRKDIDKISLKEGKYLITKLDLTYQSNLMFFLFNCHLISLATSHSGLNKHLGFISSKLLLCLTPTEIRHENKPVRTVAGLLLLAKGTRKGRHPIPNSV